MNTSTHNLHAKGGSGEDFTEYIGRQIGCGIHENRRWVCVLLRKTRRTHPIARSNSACATGLANFRSMVRSNADMQQMEKHRRPLFLVNQPRPGTGDSDSASSSIGRDAQRESESLSEETIGVKSSLLDASRRPTMFSNFITHFSRSLMIFMATNNKRE
jgi:hypothetical protein